MNNPTANSLWW